MATINGVTFNMRNLRPVAVHRNSISEQPGSDTNFITDMGYDGLVLRLEGFEETLATYDSVISEFMKSGEQTLVHRTGWQFKVYSAQLTPELIQGFADNYFPYDLILYTSTPYRESTTETTRSKTITTNNQEWSADDSTNDIDTDGSVDAVPDIQVTGGAGSIESTSQTETDTYYNFSNSLSAVSIDSSTENSNIGVPSGYGQTFDPISIGMGIIDSIAIHVSNYISTGNCTCKLYASNSTGSNLIGSKTISISSNGEKLFTFATPLPVIPANGILWFTINADSGSYYLDVDTTQPYAGGTGTNQSGGGQNWDLYFKVNGHSIKEIRQTFKVSTAGLLDKVIINMDDYQYAGSEQVKVEIKEGATLLGYGYADAPAAYADATFNLEEESNLTLSTGTTYTLIVYPPSDSGNSTNLRIKTKDTSVYADGAVTLVEDGGTARAQTHDLYFKLYMQGINIDVEVYNTADTTVKCAVANEILYTAIHRINTDGTGSIDLNDDFTTDKYLKTTMGFHGITHDEGNDELDIADDGYIYWKCDAKGPVTGIPTLTSQINITTGSPTIQISINASDWYDITTAIVDDVNTVYELDSSSLHLKGNTLFYWRIDCVKAGAATCSIKSFELDVNIVTIDFENPKITSNGANTFRCDQDSSSGMNCTVALIYRDRSWPA